MPNCAVINCKNSTYKGSLVHRNISFHRFPTDPKTKSKWIDATGHKDWFPRKFSTICSLHFKEEEFILTKSNRRLLFGKAYPTIQILKTTSTENCINEPSTSKDEDDDGEEEDDEEKNCSKNVNVKSTVKKKSILESPRKTIMVLRKRLKEQKLKIKSLHEKNRRKAKKIVALERKIESLQKSLKDNMTESLEVSTKEEEEEEEEDED